MLTYLKRSIPTQFGLLFSRDARMQLDPVMHVVYVCHGCHLRFHVSLGLPSMSSLFVPFEYEVVYGT